MWRADNTERTKRYIQERPGERRTHVHVRRAGSFSEQFALLLRDRLRAHTAIAGEYAQLKHDLARAGFDVYRDALNTPAFLAVLPDVRGQRGLDVGCGEGHNTRLLAERGRGDGGRRERR